MSTQDETTLIKLADSDVTIAAESIDVRGYPVRDKDGEEVGQVADLLIDPQERRVRFLLVTHGGFLGIGKTESFLPVDTITDITADEVRTGSSRETISSAPGYDPEIVPDLRGSDESYLGGVYGHYGLTPFWREGYVYPAMWTGSRTTGRPRPPM